jgi:hypothetical protein
LTSLTTAASTKICAFSGGRPAGELAGEKDAYRKDHTTLDRDFEDPAGRHVEPSIWTRRIMCPADDTGRISVRPSTKPRKTGGKRSAIHAIVGLSQGRVA